MVLNGEEGLECEVHVDGMQLEYVSEFKYLGCFHRKVVSERKGAVGIRFLVNARSLQLQCARVLHETCLFPFLCMVVRQ